MDDFFLRPEQRTLKRLAEPGGNVDWERFLSEVLVPVRQGKAAVYRPYDCQTGELCPPLTARISPMVLKGSSSCFSCPSSCKMALSSRSFSDA